MESRRKRQEKKKKKKKKKKERDRESDCNLFSNKDTSGSKWNSLKGRAPLQRYDPPPFAT